MQCIPLAMFVVLVASNGMLQIGFAQTTSERNPPDTNQLSPLQSQLLLEEVELESLRQSLGDGHPQVKSVLTRIAALKKGMVETVGTNPGSTPKRRDVEQIYERSSLAQIEEILGPNHPQVQSLRRRWADLEKLAPNRNDAPASGANPFLLQQLALEKARLDDVRAAFGQGHPQAKNVEAEIATLEKLLKSTDPDEASDSALIKEKLELEKLKRSYGNGHPQVKGVQARILFLEKNLKKKSRLATQDAHENPSNKVIEAERLREQQNLEQLRTKLAEQHPLVQASLLRIRLLNESLLSNGAEEIPVPGTGKQGDAPNMTAGAMENDLLQLSRNRYQVDRMLCGRVAKELQLAKSGLTANSSRIEELEAKLKHVAADALVSRNELLKAELVQLRSAIEAMEKAIEQDEKVSEEELERFMTEFKESP